MKKQKQLPLHRLLLIIAITIAGTLGNKKVNSTNTITMISSRAMETPIIRSNNTTLISDSTKKINDVVDSLNVAKQTKDETDITEVKDKLETLESEILKEKLENEVEILEEEIYQKELFEKLNNELTKIKKSLNEKDLKNVKNEIENVTISENKEKLEKIISSIETKIKKKKEEEKAKQEQLRLQKLKQQKSSYQVIIPEEGSEALEIVKGSISAYSPYCDGCAGYVAYGINVANNIYYNDKTYGNIRIVAGDSSYPFGTIVRFKNLNGKDLYAIVLDRGGVIGKGKLRLFDLLFQSEKEAYSFGVAYNVECEILRYGF